MPSEKITIGFDEFFKIACKEVFTLLGYHVETDVEIFKKPKRLDVLVLRRVENLDIDKTFFSYWKDYNLISYKSIRDTFTIKDIRSASLYLNGYLNLEKPANEFNSTITLIINQKPKKFFSQYASFISCIKEGYYKVDYNIYSIYLINLKEIALDSEEALFFCSFVDENRLEDFNFSSKKSRSLHKKTLAKLREILYIRIGELSSSYLKEKLMSKVKEIDITHIIKPHYERGIKDGIEQDRYITVQNMFKHGYTAEQISEITDFPLAKVEEYLEKK